MSTKWLGSAVLVALVLAGGAFMSGAISFPFVDTGIDVRNTACEDISAARLSVATELGARIEAADAVLRETKNEISDSYWAKNQELEREYYACSSRALTSDPCKDASDRITALYEEIMADFNAGNGFNEAKFNEREEAKKEYNECVANTQKPEFYADQEAECVRVLNSGKEANLRDREAKEASAQSVRDASVKKAESAHDEKQAILDAIEAKCTEPGTTSTVLIGPLTTEGSGAAVKPASASCTGVFQGNDSELERELVRLETRLAQAKAAGKTDGLFGTDHLQEAVDRVREELRNTPRSCKVDSDCGDPAPVCCSGTEVGQAFCNAGVCSAKKTTCVSPEICAGKPAMCVAPLTGQAQSDGIYITRSIPEVGACSKNLEVLNFEQATSDSVRYSIVGNIPSWLSIVKQSGTLPSQVTVTYSCNTVQGFGPGTYEAKGSVTVLNGAYELINTIPFSVVITVTPVEKVIEVIEYSGKFLPVSQLVIEGHEGCGEEHWHAPNGAVTATDGSVVYDPGPQCGFGKVSTTPVKTVQQKSSSNSGTQGVVRGLESLKMR